MAKKQGDACGNCCRMSLCCCVLLLLLVYAVLVSLCCCVYSLCDCVALMFVRRRSRNPLHPRLLGARAAREAPPWTPRAISILTAQKLTLTLRGKKATKCKCLGSGRLRKLVSVGVRVGVRAMGRPAARPAAGGARRSASKRRGPAASSARHQGSDKKGFCGKRGCEQSKRGLKGGAPKG